MDRRLRPVRKRAIAVLAAALLVSAYWVGWWTLGPLVIAAGLFRVADSRAEEAAHPEYWMLGAWTGAEAVIAVSLALAGSWALTMLGLLAIPVVTLSARFSTRGVWVGVAVATGLMAAVAFGTNATLVADKPPLLIAPVAVAIAIAMLSTALMKSDVEHRDKAILDPLTGLLNRRSLATRVAELEQQSARTREPVGVVAVDLDGLKTINDTHGHQVGDAVLVEVAYLLRKGLGRAFDYAYRTGGDEFVLLLPGASLEDATSVAEKARAEVGAARPTASFAVSISCGVSASEHGEPFDYGRVYLYADRGLYEVKQGECGVVTVPCVETSVVGPRTAGAVR